MYPLEVRKFAVVVYDNCKSLRKASALSGISKSSISRWKNSTERKPYKNRGSKLDNPIVIDVIKCCLQLHRFATVYEIRQHLQETCKLDVSNELLRLFIKKTMKMSNQKPRFYPEPNETTLKQKTKEYIEQFEKALEIPNCTLVSIDEVGFSSNTRPLKGLNRKGTRFQVHFRPCSSEKEHISCCCSIYNSKLTYSRLQGHFSKSTFLNFLEKQKYPIDSILLMDNVRFHHSKIVKEYCFTRKWHIVCTPPYSPWFNPIERAFSIIKNHFRKHRSIEKAFDSIIFKKIDNILLSAYKEIANAKVALLPQECK